MAAIEGKVAYQRNCFKRGNDLIPPSWHYGDLGQAPVTGGPIICQVDSKDQEGRGLP